MATTSAAATMAAAMQRIKNRTVDRSAAELASEETLLVDLRKPKERGPPSRSPDDRPAGGVPLSRLGRANETR
jgi:hypothetical protein